MPMRRLVFFVVALFALLGPVLAGAAKPANKYLWATVNLCDTAGAPDTIGIRASMPGNGTRQQLYMRFEAQRFDAANHRYVPSGSSSRWIRVGSARFKSAQAGFSFQFGLQPGTEATFRGLVDFEWRARRNGRQVVVRQEARITRAGIEGVGGGDPPNTSAATCVIR